MGGPFIKGANKKSVSNSPMIPISANTMPKPLLISKAFPRLVDASRPLPILKI